MFVCLFVCLCVFVTVGIRLSTLGVVRDQGLWAYLPPSERGGLVGVFRKGCWYLHTFRFKGCGWSGLLVALGIVGMNVVTVRIYY